MNLWELVKSLSFQSRPSSLIQSSYFIPLLQNHFFLIDLYYIWFFLILCPRFLIIFSVKWNQSSCKNPGFMDLHKERSSPPIGRLCPVGKSALDIDNNSISHTKRRRKAYHRSTQSLTSEEEGVRSRGRPFAKLGTKDRRLKWSTGSGLVKEEMRERGREISPFSSRSWSRSSQSFFLLLSFLWYKDQTIANSVPELTGQTQGSPRMKFK